MNSKFYKFNSLKTAYEFQQRSFTPMYIFHSPINGYWVVGSHTAKRLWDAGHSDIVWSASLDKFVTIPQS